MNKKFLSAILFGALMVTSTGTFVSCKDYDDDIDNLQEQINKLATKEDMASQIATLQAALTAAAKDASDAISKATAAEAAAKAAGNTAAEAEAAADKAAAEAKAAAIEAAKAEVAATKADLEKLVADGLAENKTEMDKMAQKLAEATKKVEDIVGKIADMVTAVELITTTGANNGYQTLNFRTIKEKENVFGAGLPGEMTFVKDAQVQVPASFRVRVSPSNAVLTPEMISLVNAQGENLDDFLTVVSVSKYTGGMWGQTATPQTRAAAETGLWDVVVALKNYDKNSFNATVMDKINGTYKYKLFAVAVNNTLSTAETREVVSGYALQLNKKDYVPQAELNYWVDYKKNVSEIRNRYASTETAAQGGLAIATGKEELKWTSTPYTSVKRKSNGSYDAAADENHAMQANGTPNDNRSSLTYIYPAVQGKAFTVSLDYSGNANIDNYYAPNAAIKGMYVTLDTRNAVESAPSEINAWKSYSYTGLDQVVEGTSVDIVIDGQNVINDIIGLRVYAVNHDGTLVDPDGRAFYVRLGADAANWNATATVITPDPNDGNAVTDEKSATAAVSLTKLTGAATATWTTDKVNNTQPAFDVYFVDANDMVIYKTNALTSFPADFSKVVKVYTMPKVNDWTKYEDNKVYNGTLTIKNANDFVLATLEVSMQKVLPTTLPAEFSIKTAQVKDGIYNCYMIPQNDSNAETWAAKTATQGSMKMTEVFNFGKGEEDQYEISFATSKKDGSNKDVTSTVSGDSYLRVASGYIDNSTKHETVIVYNYGLISSNPDLNNSGKGYKITGTDKFETIYNCVYNSTYTWNWATREQLNKVQTAKDYLKKDDKGAYIESMPYKTELTYGTDYACAADSYIYGVSAWDGIYSGMLNQPYKSNLIIESATLTSDANNKEEYFAVEVTKNHIVKFNAIQNSSTTNPTAAVPSTLTIKAKDMYSHEVVIKVKMTVNKR